MKYRVCRGFAVAIAGLCVACNQSNLRNAPQSDDNSGADTTLVHGDSDVPLPLGDGQQQAGDSEVNGDLDQGGDNNLPPGDGSGCGITIAHTVPPYLTLETPLLRATIAGSDNATLYYRLANPGTDFAAITMTHTGQQFTADLSDATLSYAGIYYYFQVANGDCTTTSPVNNPSTVPYFVDIVGGMQLTHDVEMHYYRPSVFGDTVVYSMFDGDEKKDKSFAFDLNTLEVTQLTDGMTSRSAAGIVEGRVVFENIRFLSDDDATRDLYMANSIGGEQLRITPRDTDEYLADFFGSMIVWRDDRNGDGLSINGDIFGFDLGPDGVAGTADDVGEFTISTDSHEESAPSLWVDRLTGRARVVWHRNSEAASFDGDIYLYDSGPDARFGTADDLGPIQITTDPDDQESPVVFDTRIVWRDDRGTGWDIYYYDLGADGLFGTHDDSGEQRLDVPTSEADNLAIWGDRLVWDDYLNGTYDVHLYDFATEIETLITSIPMAQIYADIHEKTLVWEDARDNDEKDDIYVYRLP